MARLLPVQRVTLRNQSRRDPQTALRMRLRELAASRVRFGYRRLTVLLRREGWAVNAERIYRLCKEDGLTVRTKGAPEDCAAPARSLTGQKVAKALSQVIAERGAPAAITVDNGTEFASTAMDVWSYQYRVQLGFIRPGRPVENGYIESFNGRLRDECLNVHVLLTLADVREKLERWRQDYNQVRPHSALGDYPPQQFKQYWRS